MARVALHRLGWGSEMGRFYDVAVSGRAIGLVGRADRGCRCWFWQHAKDSARRPRTGSARTRKEAVAKLVANDRRFVGPAGPGVYKGPRA
jgi:hypothetical protein